MLRHNQPALQIRINDTWKYVFCHNRGEIITTDDRHKALNSSFDLHWFSSKFGSREFRSDK